MVCISGYSPIYTWRTIYIYTDNRPINRPTDDRHIHTHTPITGFTTCAEPLARPNPALSGLEDEQAPGQWVRFALHVYICVCVCVRTYMCVCVVDWLVGLFDGW
jgi:hypothetical protein